MTTFELGNRVTVVNAPGRPSMQEQELPHLLRAEGTIHDMREVGGNVRIVVDFDNGTRYWFYEDELKLVNGVQNLTAVVPAYEAAADALPIELPEPLEVLGIGDFVHITPHYGKRPYFAYVEAVMGDRVVVSHWSFGYVCEHGVEEVALKLKKAALEAETASA